MFLKTTLLLMSLLWCVHSEDLSKKKESIPVYPQQSDYVVVDSYHGSLGAKSLELFKNVETLVFKNCNFSTFNENFLHPLKNLKKFVFTNCHYKKVKDDTSTCCEKLREFELIDSTVGTMADEEFKKIATMPKLEKIKFHKLAVPTLRANVLVGSHLKNIEINHANLDVIEDGALNGMDKLEVLDLQHNKIKSVPTASLAAVKTLKELNLRGNLLEKVTTDDIPLLPNLEKLNLGHNPIKEIDLTGLNEKLPNIKQIDVSGIHIDLTKAKGLPLLKKQID